MPNSIDPMTCWLRFGVRALHGVRSLSFACAGGRYTRASLIQGWFLSSQSSHVCIVRGKLHAIARSSIHFIGSHGSDPQQHTASPRGLMRELCHTPAHPLPYLRKSLTCGVAVAKRRTDCRLAVEASARDMSRGSSAWLTELFSSSRRVVRVPGGV